MNSIPAEFRADEAALVIIDTQEKWVPMIPNRHTLVANMRTLLKLARCFEMPIVVAEHLPWVIGETVNELRELLDSTTPVIKKTVYNTFDDPWNTVAFEGLRHIELHDGIPANARSQGVSDIWLAALPHVLNQFAYQADKDPARQNVPQASPARRRSA